MSDRITDLSNEAQRHAANNRWGYYRNVRYETADHEHEKGNWQRAGFLYMEVMIFDLQGVASILGSAGADGFLPAYRSSTPAVARKVAQFSLREQMGKEALRTAYDRVTDQFWQDAFPRSKSEIWREMWGIIWEHRQEIRLQKRIEQLGPTRLLPEEDAKTFVQVKDDYEIVQRVEQILDVEDPSNIPRAKQKRAQLYLSAVNTDQLSDRWKAKVYRRSGELALSRGDENNALYQFENARDVAGIDDRRVVDRMIERLQGTRR